MSDFLNAEAAINLAELARELEDMEAGRVLLLRRLEALRAELLAAGNRTSAMRATFELVCDHLADVAANQAELRAIEEEMREIKRTLAVAEEQAAGLQFEAEGLVDTLDEAEGEMEGLSGVLLEGKTRPPRGH